MNRSNVLRLTALALIAGSASMTGCSTPNDGMTITARQRVSIPAPGTVDVPMVASAPPTQIMLGASDSFGHEVHEYYLAHVNDADQATTQVAEVNTDH